MLSQLEYAEMKLLRFVWDRRGRRLDECKGSVRKSAPHRKIFRRNRKPAESEHVAAGFGHVPYLLPGDFIDHQSFHPFEACGQYSCVGRHFRACRPRAKPQAPASRRRRGAARMSPSPVSTGPVLRCADRLSNSSDYTTNRNRRPGARANTPSGIGRVIFNQRRSAAARVS
jgi:hypothetical protein